MSHLLLIDASGFVYRAFSTSNPIHRESDGQPIGATLRFMEMVWRLLGAAEADKPTHGAAVFDAPGKNFRHKLFPAYKANRDPARSLVLDDQIPFMWHAAETLGLTPIKREGFEADDVIATLASQARAAGIRVTIVSSDKDFGQLVVDNEIEIVDPMARKRVLAADIELKFGVPPALVADVQALAGDAIDGIPGIPGCGLKRAAALVRRFGDLEAVLKNAADCHWPQVRTELKRKAKDARLFKRLTTLRQDVELEIGPAALKLEPIMRSHLMEILRALEAPAYMQAIFKLDPQMTRVVEHAADEFGWWAEELKIPGQKIPLEPQSGFYQRKLVQGGPFVPARVWREPEIDVETKEPTGRDLLRCEVGGRPRDPFAEWTRLSMAPIARSKFKFEEADSAHAKKWRPGDPKATPHIKIDLLKQPAPRNPKYKGRQK